MNELFAKKIEGFRFPRYKELPDMGLYLEQVTKYINGIIVPLGCNELTPSMVSNYVKKGVISAPQKKQYYAEQIAYLLFISVGKSVLSIEDMMRLFEHQKKIYDTKTAYDYFCCEFENMLFYIAGLKEAVENVGVTNSHIKDVLRCVIISISNMIFVSSCFEELDKSANEQK